MPSLLSRLAVLAITLRGSKREFSSAERTLAKVKRVNRRPKPFAPRRSVGKRVHITPRAFDAGHGQEWPVYDLTPKSGGTGARALYLHGGCYVYEIDPFHWTLIADLAERSGATITVPIFPLAPHSKAATVMPSLADLAADLVEEVGADRTSVIGDSAGAGMALVVAQLLRDRGIPPLHATVLISPWLDISGEDPRLAEIAPRDPWLAIPGTHAAGGLWRGELDPHDPLVSPLFGNLARLGPVTMFSGSRDILNADAVKFRARAVAAGLALDYHEAPGMIHNYPILPIPEAEPARQVIAAALRE
jgi:monoterpene epsilon-lactone hydrolase